MAKEHLVFDPHGGHQWLDGDDGSGPSAFMVLAARRRGIIPAITSHNTMAGVEGYLQAMEDVGYGKVGVPGVEFSYHVDTFDYNWLNTHELTPEMRIVIGPGHKKFARGEQSTNEKNHQFSPEELIALQEHIISTIESFTQQPASELVKQAQAITKAYQASNSRFLADPPPFDQTLKVLAGLGIATSDKGFSLYYHLASQPEYLEDLKQRMILSHEATEESFNEAQAAPEAIKMAMHAWTYWEYQAGKGTEKNNKGELICLMPKEKSFTHKMTQVVAQWKESGAAKTMPLTALLDHLHSRLTADEYDSMIKYLPHPLSIDTTFLGKLAVKVMEGDIALYSPELWTPEIARTIDAIEILNGAHPGVSNRLSARLAENRLTSHMSPMGGSDSHDPSWVGSAGTLLRVDQVSTEGILAAIRNGETAALSGWGEKSETWLPFAAWLFTVPIKGKLRGPDFVRDQIKKQTSLTAAALNAHQNFENRASKWFK